MSTWAPYTVGNWLWVHGHYVWIARDPWCWAPSHYGRWIFMASRGWCWVPPAIGAAYWSPGYVGWIVTPTYVAWVPLAPGEIYYGYGYYGPWSRNITTVDANTVVVNRTYINARITASVVVVQRDTFGTGRRVPVRITENPFMGARQRPTPNIDIVPPREKPRMPIVLLPERSIQGQHQTPEQERVRPQSPVAVPPAIVNRPSSPQVLPPERFRKIRPEEMKNERRLIREREASVFRSQPPENLPVTKMREPRVIIRKPGQQPQKPVKGDGREQRQERLQGR